MAEFGRVLRTGKARDQVSRWTGEMATTFTYTGALDVTAVDNRLYDQW